MYHEIEEHKHFCQICGEEFNPVWDGNSAMHGYRIWWDSMPFAYPDSKEVYYVCADCHRQLLKAYAESHSYKSVLDYFESHDAYEPFSKAMSWSFKHHSDAIVDVINGRKSIEEYFAERGYIDLVGWDKDNTSNEFNYEWLIEIGAKFTRIEPQDYSEEEIEEITAHYELFEDECY